MIAIIVLIAVSFLLFRLLGGAPQLHIRRRPTADSAAAKIDELTEYAQKLRSNNKYTGAEKVYLQILKLDHRHTATYSNLGSLYSIQKNYADAIECFEITTQLNPSGSTFYNLGLANYENRNFAKAVAAFEKAVMFEPSVQRYVGLAKAFSKQGDGESMIRALEQAAALEPKPKVLWLLADAYEAAERYDELPELYAKIRSADPKDQRLKLVAKNRSGVSADAVAKLEKPVS